MNLFKKIAIPTEEKQELTAYQTYYVRWISSAYYTSDRKQRCEVFLNKEDAEKFKIALKEAHKLLKSTDDPKIEITNE